MNYSKHMEVRHKRRKEGIIEYKAASRNLFFICESHSVVYDSLQPHGLYSPCNSPGQNIGVGSRSLLQGIFLTQGLNPGLPHCRQILYQLNHQGSPRILGWVAYISSPGDLPDTGLEAGVSCIAGRFFTAEPPGKPCKYYGNK